MTDKETADIKVEAGSRVSLILDHPDDSLSVIPIPPELERIKFLEFEGAVALPLDNPLIQAIVGKEINDTGQFTDAKKNKRTVGILEISPGWLQQYFEKHPEEAKPKDSTGKKLLTPEY